jgi:hypothetical protein
MSSPVAGSELAMLALEERVQEKSRSPDTKTGRSNCTSTVYAFTRIDSDQFLSDDLGGWSRCILVVLVASAPSFEIYVHSYLPIVKINWFIEIRLFPTNLGGQIPRLVHTPPP